MGVKTTPQPPFWPFMTPGGGFMPLGGSFTPPPLLGGVVLSPQMGGVFSPKRWFYPPIRSFWEGGYHPFVVVLSPFSVMLSVNPEPQYRKTSCLTSKNTLGDGGGGLLHFHFGLGGTRGDGGSMDDIWFYTQCFASHCSLYKCYRMFDLAEDNCTSGV